MSVCRVNKTDNYTVMSNHHLRDMNLSLKAKGLLSMMLSLPPEWDYSIAGLCAICKESETAIKSALNELKEFGYVVVTKVPPRKGGKSTFEYIYDIFENPDQSLEGGFLPVVPQPIEDQGQLNKDNKIKKIEVEELRSLTDLSTAELQKLKDEVIRNRDTKAKSYISIQKKFKLKDTVSYTTPELCDELINSRNTSKPSRSIPLSEEVF